MNQKKNPDFSNIEPKLTPDEVWVSIVSNIVIANDCKSISTAINWADRITEEYKERFYNENKEKTWKK